MGATTEAAADLTGEGTLTTEPDPPAVKAAGTATVTPAAGGSASVT